MTTKEMTDQMIARRVRGGYNEAESRAQLVELLSNYTGDNLAFALCYEGFATEAKAYKFIRAINEKAAAIIASRA